ncbi:MAG: MerR family transcriptional regulator [Pseudomonadota bacterium]
MLSRAELQAATGLSRKAIRVYEERGILSPIRDTKCHATYDEGAVLLGRMIATLRRANVSLEDIKRVTELQDECDDAFVEQLKARLRSSAQDMHTAVQTIDSVCRSIKAKVFCTRYGGFWATGRKEKIDKSRVGPFLSGTAEELNGEGIPLNHLSLQYSDVAEQRLTAYCFIRCEAPAKEPKSTLQSYYVPEQVCFGIKAKHCLNDLSKFDPIYDRIQAERLKTGRRKSSTRTIEITSDIAGRFREDQEVETVLFS